jgi:hypothetical protein
MQRQSPDAAEYQFLTTPGAAVQVRLAADREGRPELQIFGNRAGLLSLANVLLWLVATAWRREFLSLAELRFVHAESPLTVCLRVTAEAETGRDGFLSCSRHGDQLEWEITEDDLRRVAVSLHRLSMRPDHEYDQLSPAEGSAAGIHVRMTDAAEWLRRWNA